MIDWTRLDACADDLRRAFAAARPFPYVVIDGAFAGLDAALAEWPGEDVPWKQNGRMKRHLRTEIPPLLTNVVREMNSRRFVEWLAGITGITDLAADYELAGGGLHETHPGGYLPLHVDFNRLGSLYRRLNVLLFMNPKWDDSWHGCLELVNNPKKIKERVIISPQFNRLVIAESSDRTWHGHPKELKSPGPRRSIATYYYSREPAKAYRDDHSTLYFIRETKFSAGAEKLL